MLDVVHLRLDVEERLKGAARLFEHAAPRMRQPVLRQVSDGENRRSNDAARIGLFEAGKDFQQCGLARTIGSAQPDPIAVINLPRDVIEEDAVAERLGEIGKLNHAVGTPNALARLTWRYSGTSSVVMNASSAVAFIEVHVRRAELGRRLFSLTSFNLKTYAAAERPGGRVRKPLATVKIGLTVARLRSGQALRLAQGRPGQGSHRLNQQRRQDLSP
jgi:hypothetical protein